MTGPSLFREEQRASQWWVWGIVALAAGLAWWAQIQQVILGHEFGDDPLPDWAVWAFWLLIGVGLPAVFFWLRLIVEVSTQEVLIRYRPVLRRTIAFTEIESLEVRTYNPVKEYGGWGIKGWSRQNVAYNASGNRGVQLTLRDGRRVMLGSQRPEELAAAIESQLGSRPRSR